MSIEAIVAATLDRIEERAFERGRQEALAQGDALDATHAAAVVSAVDDAGATVIAALVAHIAGTRAIGEEAVTVQVHRIEGRYRVTVHAQPESLGVSVTREE